MNGGWGKRSGMVLMEKNTMDDVNQIDNYGELDGNTENHDNENSGYNAYITRKTMFSKMELVCRV